MATIDFKQFKLITSLTGEKVVVNASEDFANIIYTRGNGVRALALAMDIFKGERTEWTNEEVHLMQGFAEMCSPAFIDSFNAYITE